MTDVLPLDRLLIDLRPEPLRVRGPLEPLVPNRVRAVTLEQIEAGTHGLTPDLGPLLVICERGIRSGLAARFLRSDGLDAEAYPGGVPALLEALQRPGG
ncbi:rhodanese-like domain-containing protein [Deinococcus sonorensis]|uniref:Rhodanese-like domain-containing protein n=2 Tax=Deinococcus sonorensis TaxID=309891 RepID=A0AAU7U7J8_9DEIO